MDTQHRSHALTLRRECVEPLLALPIAPLLLALLLDQTVQLLLEQSLTLRLLREKSALGVVLGVRLELHGLLCPSHDTLSILVSIKRIASCKNLFLL